jgi:hypothetical protein
MLRSSVVAGLVCLILAPTVFAAAGPPSPRTVTVLGLVEQLGDRDHRVAETAARRLLDLAPAALPLVRQALAHRDPEVRRRALRLLPALEGAVLFAPRRVTLTVRNQPLQGVLEALTKASGYNVRSQGVAFLPAPGQPPEKRYSYDIVDEPFWDVVERICRDGNLTVQHNWGDDLVWLHSSTGHAPHVGRSGAFRYAASSFQLRRDVGLGADANRTENLTFHFVITAEPRLSFAQAYQPRIEAAYDDLRESLLARAGQSGSTSSLSGGVRSFTLSASVNLERRSPKATRLTLLRGVIPVSIQARQRDVVLADRILTARGKTTSLDGMDFRIEEVSKANNRLNVRFSVTSKTNDLSSLRQLYYRVALFDEKGGKVSWNSASSHSGSNGAGATMTYILRGAQAPPPTKFVFLHWETKRCLIPFEFRNVPLP